MEREISNNEDVLDSRDINDRIDELEDIEEPDEDEAEELRILKELADEASGYSEDWRYGATLVRDSYWVDYCEELVKDIGDMPKDLPSYIVIDWDATAENIKADYTSVEFDGVTYWVR